LAAIHVQLAVFCPAPFNVRIAAGYRYLWKAYTCSKRSSRHDYLGRYLTKREGEKAATTTTTKTTARGGRGTSTYQSPPVLVLQVVRT
jgi:hypothetical protein